MASNTIPKATAPLITLGEDAADGAAHLGGSLGLAHHTEPKIRADLVAFAGDETATPPKPGKLGLHNAAKTRKLAATSAHRTAESNARAFAAGAIGVLKHYLGRQWTSAWREAGFNTGSLSVPDDPLSLLTQLRAYFVAHPAHENAPLGVTAAAAEAQRQSVSDARTAANDAIAALGVAKQERDTAQETLRSRLSGLLAELGQVLEDDDPRWYSFGFDRPADGEQPAPVSGLTLTAGGAGTVLADWDDARRAERYRVWRQVAGVDTTPVLVNGTLHDSETTLSGLPSGKELTVAVAAVNDAGEGPVATTGAFRIP